MDTEEDMPRPDELRDGTLAEINALRDLLSQIGDPDAAHDAGVIDDDEYVERKARKLAYTSALAAYANGEVPDLPALLEQMRTEQTEADKAQLQEMLGCVQTGEAYTQPEAAEQPIAVDHADIEDKSEEKSGFFHKLFRSHRFG